MMLQSYLSIEELVLQIRLNQSIASSTQSSDSLSLANWHLEVITVSHPRIVIHERT
jgi:hypothetical protein